MVARFTAELVSASWDSLILSTGGEALVRLPLRYPLKGTRALVGAAIEEAETPAALLAALGVTRLGGTAHRDSSEV